MCIRDAKNSNLLLNNDYYSFKIFPQFWLAKSTRIIHHNQLLMTKFGRILCLRKKWRQNAAFYWLMHRLFITDSLHYITSK